MPRSAVAVLLGCLYVAGSSWLVLREGENYRESRHQERLAAAGSPISPLLASPSDAATDNAAGASSSIPPPTEDPSAKRAAAARVQPATSSQVESPPPIPTVPPARANPLPASPPAPVLSPAIADRPATVPVPPPAGDSFWRQPYLRESWDLTNLRPEDEARLGAGLHQLILELNPRSETGPWQQRVEEAAKPFLKACARKDISYTFTVLESDAICAFSHPGGYVYVCRGLFDLIGEDEDYALEFAVGHEIAHVDLGHALASLRDPGVIKLPLGTLQKAYMIIIPYGHVDDAEFAADRWAYSRMRQAGRSERKALAFLRKLRGYAEQNGFSNGRGKPKPSIESSVLENHYRAHTATWKRLDRLNEFISAASAPKR